MKRVAKSDASYTAMLRTGSDPVLHQACDRVNPGESLDFLFTLKRVCQAAKNGVGLAAPQIGLLKRAFVMHVTRSEWVFCVNPCIVDASDEMVTHVEGCLSYPGKQVRISRNAAIKMRWMDERLAFHLEWFTGLPAIIAAHESDHTEGVCLVGAFETPDPTNPETKAVVQDMRKPLQIGGRLTAVPKLDLSEAAMMQAPAN